MLGKDAGHRPASLLKISLFYRCFSNILMVKINYLVSTKWYFGGKWVKNVICEGSNPARCMSKVCVEDLNYFCQLTI